MKPLTAQQEAFAVAVASGATQLNAYRLAYPRAQRWKDNAATAAASNLAGAANVAARIAELQRKAADANEVTVERIVAELAKIAFGDLREVMTWGSGGVVLKESQTLNDAAAGALAEVSETQTKLGPTLKVKRHDKVAALKLLAEIRGAVVKRAEVTGKDGAPLAAPGVTMTPEQLAALAVKMAKEV